jgi:putative redox protein
MFRLQTSRYISRHSNSGILRPKLSLRCPFSSSPIILQKVPFYINGEGTGVAQTVSVQGSLHKIRVDAYLSFGGNDSAPTPLVYLLTSLCACTQVTGSLVAKDLGIKLGKWKVSVKGDLPTAVLVKGEQGNSNWDNIEVEVRV